MKVVISPHNVVSYPEGGGHFWVYLQYVQGLRSLGCDVWWMEEFVSSADSSLDRARVAALRERLDRYGMHERLILYTPKGEFLNLAAARARTICHEADLLLNFHQRIQAWVLEAFRRTALVDIDPGLLQYWISSGELAVHQHDLYFTTGETVGTPEAKFSDCGLDWISIRPAVSLDLWPRMPAALDAPFTTVSGWWGRSEWITDGDEVYDNNKRSSFLRFAELPRHTRVPLELALYLNLNSPDDEADLGLLTRNGWRIKLSPQVAGTPEKYQQYIQGSRGEFSCAKPSCMRLQNAWISDRTLCYLATGRPAVVENTGPSRILPNGLGLFRFSTLEEAVAGLEEIAAYYRRHADAARELAEFFDARRVAEDILRHCHDGALAVAERSKT
jgi:hypothetical protein